MIRRIIGAWFDRLRPPHVPDPDPDPDSVARRVVAGWSEAPARSIRPFLGADVVLVVDGGPDVTAPRAPLVGRDEAAAYLDEALRSTTLTVRPARVNGQAGAVLCRDERVVGVLSFELRRGAITRGWLVVNPDKLRRWNP